MPSVFTIRKQLLQALQDGLLPVFAEQKSPHWVLAELPVHIPEDVEVTHLPVPLLDNRPLGMEHEWPQEKLNSTFHLKLAILFEGQIDFRIGTTKRMADAAVEKNEWTKHGCHILRLTAPACVLIPPEVPGSDGSGAHWDDPAVTPPDSKILWINSAPTGVLCHICHTRDGAHKPEHSLLVQDDGIPLLLSLLLSELRRRALSSTQITYPYLIALLFSLRRYLCDEAPILANTIYLPPPESVINDKPSSYDRIIQTADEYVALYLREPISLQDIARHCGVSPTHLNRVFNKKLGMSTMQYISQRRIKSAQRILVDTDLPIKEIANLVGFSRASHFCRVFQRTMNLSPTDYRRERKD